MSDRHLIPRAPLGALCCCLLVVSSAAAAEPDGDDPDLRTRIEAAADQDDLRLIEAEIADAIAHGATIYNLGNHEEADPQARAFFQSSCFKIYEGAAYKLLVELDDRLPPASDALRAALAETAEEEDWDRNAWTMRRCFDRILGSETVGAPAEEDDAPEDEIPKL